MAKPMNTPWPIRSHSEFGRAMAAKELVSPQVGTFRTERLSKLKSDPFAARRNRQGKRMIRA